MLHRIALLVAAIAASLTLAVALEVAGFDPATSPAPAATAIADAAEVAAPPPVQVDKVYVGAPQAQQTVTVQRVVGGGGGESEGAEGGD
jgi:hypothetical protein